MCHPYSIHIHLPSRLVSGLLRQNHDHWIHFPYLNQPIIHEYPLKCMQNFMYYDRLCEPKTIFRNIYEPRNQIRSVTTKPKPIILFKIPKPSESPIMVISKMKLHCKWIVHPVVQHRVNTDPPTDRRIISICIEKFSLAGDPFLITVTESG